MLATLNQQLWLNLKEAAMLYRIPVATFQSWIYHGILHEKNGLHRAGHLIRIDRRAFEAEFFDSKQLPTPPSPTRRRKSIAAKA